jgi:hypothetical protein
MELRHAPLDFPQSFFDLLWKWVTQQAKYLLLLLLVVVLMPPLALQAQADTCLSPRFFGGQWVRVTGSLDAGGLPFRAQHSLSAPVLGFIPLDRVVESAWMQRCVEGRNWYSVWYGRTDSEAPEEVWVMDGDGHTYWLEPLPYCQEYDQREHIFPSPMDYEDGLIVDSFDEQTKVLRFSANYRPVGEHSLERHYFTLDLDTELVTQTDYWYRDIVTRQLTDRLGITEQVFGEEEDFSTVYVSPDRTRILYRNTNPPIPDCAHGCITETLWIADSDGSNPRALSDFYGWISRIVWGNDGRIHLSMFSKEVWSPEFTLTVCIDGSCTLYLDELILGERSLPLEDVLHMPMWSPNGQWIAVTMGSEQLYNAGIPSTGFVVEQNGDRFIQLPYNGQAASPIIWMDNDTLLYPVRGVDVDEAQDGLPTRFYTQDALWEIDLDFEALTYRIGDRLTYCVGDRNDRLFDPVETHHIIAAGNKAIVYSRASLDIYCFWRG